MGLAEDYAVAQIGANLPHESDPAAGELARLQLEETRRKLAEETSRKEAQAAADVAAQQARTQADIEATKARLEGRPASPVSALPIRKDAAAVAAGASAAANAQAKADGVRDLLPSAEGTPDTSTLDVTRPPGVGPPPPPRAPIKAVRDPSTGKVTFTNIGTEGAGEPAGAVNYDDAIAKIRANQYAATRGPVATDSQRAAAALGGLQDDPTKPGFETASLVPGQLGGQSRQLVDAANRAYEQGRKGSVSMVELGVGDNGDMTPMMREILQQRRADKLADLQAKAAEADVNEKLRIAALSPEERIIEEGRRQAAVSEAAGITPGYMQRQQDIARKQAEAHIKATGRWDEYQKNPEKFEAAIQQAMRESIAADIEKYLQGAGRGQRSQSYQ